MSSLDVGAAPAAEPLSPILIEAGGEDAGLAVPLARGYRFYSGAGRFHELDGRIYDRLTELRQDVASRAAAERRPGRGRLKGFVAVR